MKIRITFSWAKASAAEKFSLAEVVTVLEQETADDVIRTYEINGRVLLKRVCALGLIGYLAAASGLFFWLSRNPYNQVGFTDLVLPWRWSGLRDRRGQTYIAEGLEALRTQHWGDGVFKIKNGLARHPHDSAARLALAKFYAKFDYYPAIREVMLPELAGPRPPREYVRFLLDWAERFDDRVTMIDVCNQVLEHGDLPAEDQRWLLETKAGALVSLRRFQEALVLLDDPRMSHSAAQIWLRVQALCGAGRSGEAVEVVRKWEPADAFMEYRLQVLAYADGEAGKLEEMSGMLSDAISRRPADAELRLFAITRYVQTGWKDAAWRELHDYLERFDADPDLVFRAARQCADAGAPDLVGQCLEDARELGQPTAQLELMLTVAQAVAGDVAGAQRTFAEYLSHQPASNLDARVEGDTSVRGWLTALLDTLGSEAPGLAEHFVEMLQRSRYNLRIFCDSIKALAKAGRWSEVNLTATAGLVVFPGSSELSRWHATAAEKIAALPKPVVVAVALRAPAAPVRPARPVPAPAPNPDAVDFRTIAPEEFMAKLDQAVQHGAWTEADGMIREARRNAPPWLVRVEGELAWIEIRGAVAQGEIYRLGYLISERLKMQKTEASRALRLAREFSEKGDADTARSIAEKIVEAVPEFKSGRMFLSGLKQPEAHGNSASAPADVQRPTTPRP
jgi:tetratricopeptide (TPR) repeat protein